MHIREITKAEEERSRYLMSQAFMRGSRDFGWAEDPNNPPYRAFGVWDDDGLQAQSVVLEYRVHVGPDVVVPMGGIAGVACLPASRGKGYAGAALRYTLEQMRDAGQVVSTLFPFSFDYYRRLGWEWVGVRRAYVLPPGILPASPESVKVRAAQPADRDAIVAVYTRYAGRYRGMVARHAKHWDGILNDTDKHFAFTYLYEHDGVPEGYVTYRGGEGEQTYLREFIALTPRARQGLLGLLRRHDMQMRKVRWEAPGDDPLWSELYHWDIETTIRPMTMGRVVDVQAGLQAWRPDASVAGCAALSVRDPAAPWNEAVWQVEFEGGRVCAGRTVSSPGVSLDIQALSQAYFGTPTVPELRAAGRLEVHDERAYSALCALLAGPPMWMNDSF